MLLSVIIFSWNSQEQLDKCLQSIDTLGLGSTETMAVDSNSEDGTVSFSNISRHVNRGADTDHCPL